MTDSQKWAIDRLTEANRIFEPNDLSRGKHAIFLMVWLAEMVLCYHLAYWFWP